MRITDLKWNKTRVQCPYCEGWFTKQGILGHIRFRHPDKKKQKAEADPIESLIKSRLLPVLVQANKMMQENGRLSEEFRGTLLDMMLIDYLVNALRSKT